MKLYILCVAVRVCVPKDLHNLLFIINTIFIKIYSSFIIQVKEDECTIFYDIAGVRTDDLSARGIAYDVNR